MNILVTGANGFIGQYLVKHLVERNHSVIATGKGHDRSGFREYNYVYRSMDFTDPDEVSKVFEEFTPAVIVHAGAMSKPNDCEKERGLAYDVNVNGTRYLLEAANKSNCFFILLSTDFVFDGEKGMYIETDEPGPVNYYGETKLEAEKLVQIYPGSWAIVRTILVYGKPVNKSANLLSIVKEKLYNNEPYAVVNDQIRTPTYIDDLVHGLALVIEKKATGIYHISGEEVRTPYQIACEVADYFEFDRSLLKEVNRSSFSEPARRPLKTGFKIDKAKRELGFEATPFKDALDLTLDVLD